MLKIYCNVLQHVRMSYCLQSTIVFNTNLCEWQIAHEITYHFVFIITCWLLFKPDNHPHNIFQEKEGVYSTDDHKAFPQISHFSIMSMKTKCLTEGVRGRKNIFNNNSVKSYLALKWHWSFSRESQHLRLLYVCVIKWWRVKLGNNFSRVSSKS